MHIRLHPEQPGRQLGDLYGLFFEDINHAADGGLYAELLCNRDFEFDPVDNKSYTPLTAWTAIGNASIRIKTEDAPFPNRPHYAVVSGPHGHYGLSNLGYGMGIPARAGAAYRLTLWARARKEATIQVSLCGAEAMFHLTKHWQKHEALLIPADSDVAARLTIMAESHGSFEVAFASLMPADTWQGQANMLRRDIAEALADMKPRFLRFPGGCLTHDGDLDPDARDGIYNWKRTLGPIENRPPRRNNWGYHQTMGLGFYEYFLFCEDLGCQPLPVLNGGIDPHHRRFAKGEVLDMYIQDALDLIDFAKGGTDTTWGRVRAEMGHPEPFGLKYLAIGNEEIHEEFHRNMGRFAAAIRAKDPEIELIGSSGPFAHGGPYDMGWDYARKQGLDHVDEHYYMSPEWFLCNADRYADYDPKGPRVFLGEYATWGNKMRNALAEAAFMTGLENAPAVSLACYAPMLCNMNYVNWQPDMIWFDGARLVKTANYHVQSMFMRHQGEVHIPVTATNNEPGASLSRPFAGVIALGADETELRATSIRLMTANGSFTYPDTVVSGDERIEIGTHDGDFRLELTLERLSGRKGGYIRFAEEDGADGKTHCCWVIGGWQNSDSALESRINGCNACLTQSNLSLETGHPYRLTLELKGRELVTTVNGVEWNRVTDAPLRLKPLYLSASLDPATGDTILKAVNVQETDVAACIDFPCEGCTAEVLCADPMDKNTFADPEAVAPVCAVLPAEDLKQHVFPAHSVTVLRMK